MMNSHVKGRKTLIMKIRTRKKYLDKKAAFIKATFYKELVTAFSFRFKYEDFFNTLPRA